VAATGFVSGEGGSIAGAGAMILNALLDAGWEVVFFSKSSFVDPRPVVGVRPGFHFVEVDNVMTDRLRRAGQSIPGLDFALRWLDSFAYNRGLVRAMRRAGESRPFDLCLWLGDYARGRVFATPTVSFVQGAPGTDARSILRRGPEVRRLAGGRAALKWKLLARLRLSRVGLPPFSITDHFVVGSSQSASTLRERYGLAAGGVSVIPYPVDLERFRPEPRTEGRALRCLWLGRIVPRKRLDVFLGGAAEAIRNGLDVTLTVVGDIGLIPGYERLMGDFPFPDRLTWIRGVPRREVPVLFGRHDVLAQPSEEEDFGSSVAEAQACGLPVIVGATNGNADYLCPRDIHLSDDRVETFAAALAEIAARRSEENGMAVSRTNAEENYSMAAVGARWRRVIEQVVAGQTGGPRP
jgi:glycosyltransferase involved in cell wall biosynthesis